MYLYSLKHFKTSYDNQNMEPSSYMYVSFRYGNMQVNIYIPKTMSTHFTDAYSRHIAANCVEIYRTQLCHKRASAITSFLTDTLLDIEKT